MIAFFYWQTKVSQECYNSFDGRPHGPPVNQAQEKPDLEEQPDKAPAGIDERPEDIRKLEAEIVFLTLRLPHLLHSTLLSLSGEVDSTSKFALQSLHLYSMMGITSPA